MKILDYIKCLFRNHKWDTICRDEIRTCEICKRNEFYLPQKYGFESGGWDGTDFVYGWISLKYNMDLYKKLQKRIKKGKQ